MKKESKVEVLLESPNVRVENFPETFNLKAKGTVLTRCAANKCSPEEIAKMDIGAIKSFVKDGEWEEYIELEGKEDPKKKYSVLWMRGIYKNGKKEGRWEEFEEKYDPSTKVKKLVKKQFGEFKDNKKEGTWTLLFETGEKLKETIYAAGKKHGTEKKFSLKGIQVEEINYIEGERDGVYWKKTASELTQCEGTFTKEQKTGKWTEYNTEEKKPGKLKAVLSYVNNKRDGSAVFYHPDGITKSTEGNYKEDYKIGFWKQYYPTGSVESEGNRKAESGTIESEEKEINDENEIAEIKSAKETKTFKEQTSACRCKGTMANALMMQKGELYDESGELEGKGNMMLSMFSIDEKTDKMKDKMIPALPFTFYKAGKKYLEILPATKNAINFTIDSKAIAVTIPVCLSVVSIFLKPYIIIKKASNKVIINVV